MAIFDDVDVIKFAIDAATILEIKVSVGRHCNH